MTVETQKKHGGSRPGAGRKKGVKFSDRTEYLGKCITKKEKDFFEDALSEHRAALRAILKYKERKIDYSDFIEEIKESYKNKKVVYDDEFKFMRDARQKYALTILEKCKVDAVADDTDFITLKGTVTIKMDRNNGFILSLDDSTIYLLENGEITSYRVLIPIDKLL